jgi:NAD(P)-dependent dehydrogenase (short-subunit alcohol dehydrogenase family)
MPKTIVITGVSGGLGRATAVAALDAGHTVIGTVRRPEQVEPFAALAPGRAHARVLDVTDIASISAAAADVESIAGPVDVLINNAGYGVEGVFEETPLDVVRRQFEVNVFGTIEVTRAFLPAMRERRAGHIVFITSMGGLRAFPGLSAYHASKYALEGLADTLRLELAPLGIAVTSIEPGSFRTEWSGQSMVRVERTIADYDAVFGPIREQRNQARGSQPGDPAKAGKAIVTIIDAPHPPGHLLLGVDAQQLVGEARRATDAEFDAWAHLGSDTQYDVEEGRGQQESSAAVSAD